jgi:hypothetical protein
MFHSYICDKSGDNNGNIQGERGPELQADGCQQQCHHANSGKDSRMYGDIKWWVWLFNGMNWDGGGNT